MWNTCWWYDCPEASKHYEEPEGGWFDEGPPWERSGPKLHRILETWRIDLDGQSMAPRWIRTLRPPELPLGGSLSLVINSHQNWVTAVEFSPDGHRFVSSSTDGTIRTWNSSSGKELLVINKGTSFTVKYSSTGERLLAGVCNCIYVFDSHNGDKIAVLKGHESNVLSVAYSSNEEFIVSGDVQGNVLIWDAESYRRQLGLRGWGASVTDLVFLPNSVQCLIAYDDGNVWAWDMNGIRKIAEIPHSVAVDELAVSPDGRQFATASDAVRLFDTEKFSELTTLDTGKVYSVAFSPDGRRLVIAGYETIRIWDVRGRSEVASIHKRNGAFSSVRYSPDGRWLVSGGTDGSICIWNANHTSPLPKLPGWQFESSTGELKFSNNGQLLASWSERENIQLWDVMTGVLLRILRAPGCVESVAFSSTSKQMVTSHSDPEGFENSVRIWNSTSGLQLNECSGTSEPIHLLSFSPDGHQIAGGSRGNEVFLWKAINGECTAVLTGHKHHISAIAFSPDGNLIASCSMDKTVRLWDASNGEQLAIMQGHENGVRCLGFSSDGYRIVSGSYLNHKDSNEFNNTLRVWDVASATAVTVICEPWHQFLNVAFSTDGSSLIAEANDARRGSGIGIWDVRSEENVKWIEGDASFAEIVSGNKKCQWRRNCIIESGSNQVIVYHPYSFYYPGVVSNPLRCLWAGIPDQPVLLELMDIVETRGEDNDLRPR